MTNLAYAVFEREENFFAALSKHMREKYGMEVLQGYTPIRFLVNEETFADAAKTVTEGLYDKMSTYLPVEQLNFGEISKEAYSKSDMDFIIRDLKLIFDFRVGAHHENRFLIDSAKIEALRRADWEVVVVWANGKPINWLKIYDSRDYENRDIVDIIERRFSMKEALSG